MSARLLLLMGLFTCAASAAEPAPATFIYQRDVGAADDRNQYEVRVLRAALEHTRAGWGGYELRASAPMPGKHRIFVLEHHEGGVNVGLFVAQSRPNDRLVPVRIPVERGILGYRVLVIRAADQARFDAVSSLEDLKDVRFGLLEWWEDVRIMRHADLAVVPGSSFDGLFHMLKARRFDALSRGVGEVEPGDGGARRRFSRPRHRAPSGAALSHAGLFLVPEHARGSQTGRAGPRRAAGDGIGRLARVPVPRGIRAGDRPARPRSPPDHRPAQSAAGRQGPARRSGPLVSAALIWRLPHRFLTEIDESAHLGRR